MGRTSRPNAGRRRPSRRALLRCLAGGGLGLVGLRLALPRMMRPGPLRPSEELSDGARAMIAAAYADVDRARVWDGHVHLVGLGSGGTGCWVNPDMRSHLHPLQRLQFELYLSASGVTSKEEADAQYIERLLALHRAANPAGKLVLLAYDYHVGEDGREIPERSPFHTPNEYVLRLAREHEDVAACVSIHPYRTDALRRLEEAAEAGAVAVKWLPNAMGIDPASELCDPFYSKLVEHGLPLLTHTGLEKAVHAEEAQKLGNPLRLRRPLDAGVTVVAAHCASLGDSSDLDAAEAERGEMASFDLFLRLMGEDGYRENLYGDISALIQVNRSGRPLRELLAAEELHPRLVNGSDYPLPAIDPVVSTLWLVHKDYLDSQERVLLNEVFDANPLLFDYLVKRRVAVERDGRNLRFAPIVFESARLYAS